MSDSIVHGASEAGLPHARALLGRRAAFVRKLRGDFAALRDALLGWEVPLWTCGAAAGIAAADLWRPGAGVAAAVGVGAAGWRLLRPRRPLFAVLASLTLGAAAGQGAYVWRRASLEAPRVSAPLRDLALCGEMTALIRDVPIRIELRALTPAIAAGVRLTLPRELRLPFPGDRVCLRADVFPLPEMMLPGGYDFAGRMFYAQIGGTGRILEVVSVEEHETFDRRIERLRSRLRRRLNAADPSGVLNALVTGDRSRISEARNEAWRKAGIYHVLSISGLHMAVLAGGTAAILRRLGAFVLPRAAALGHLRAPIAVAAVLPAGAYLLLAGSSPPAMRSLLMTALAAVAFVMNGHAAAARTLFLSAGILLLWTPETLYDIGARLSYSAVAAVLIADALFPTPKAGTRMGALWCGIRALLVQSAAVTVATAPLTAYTFNRLSFYGVFVNLVAVPVSGPWLMGALTFGVLLMPLGWEGAPLEVAAAAVRVLNVMADTVAQWPYAEFRMTRPPGALPLACAVASAVLLIGLRRPRGPALCAGVLMLPLLLWPAERIDFITDAEHRNVLDVAAGDFCVEKRRPYLLKTWRERAGLREDQVRVHVSRACRPPPEGAAGVLLAASSR